MTRILLLENKACPLHRLRVESRRSGVCFQYDAASNSAEFVQSLASHPSILVCSLDGLAELPIDHIVERARQAAIPLLLVGGELAWERELLARFAGRFHLSCRRNRLSWLPLLLERTVRELHSVEERRVNQNALDVQLQQTAEQMRDVQKLAIVGRLTGSIVHEINNPLESISNLNYLLSTDKALPAHLRQYVEIIERELARVTRISTQTLSFCRETQSPMRVQLSSLLDEVLVLYGRRLAEKRVKVTRLYESEEPLLLFPGEIRQVYANLIANAIEATAPGGRISLRLRRTRLYRPHGSVDGVRLLVADSGSGIDPQTAARLGQPFFTTKGQRGTGLGLWVSRAIVERYNGHMQLRSSTAPNRHGTTFSVFLPLNLGPHKVESTPGGGEKLQTPLAERAGSLEGIRLRAGSSS